MGAYGITWGSVLCGDLNGKEIQKREGICTCAADSPCYTAEMKTTLQSNYTPIKKKRKKKEKKQREPEGMKLQIFSLLPYQ